MGDKLKQLEKRVLLMGSVEPLTVGMLIVKSFVNFEVYKSNFVNFNIFINIMNEQHCVFIYIYIYNTNFFNIVD